MGLLFVPRPAQSACTSAAEVAALTAALQGRLACARLRVDGGAAIPCATPAVPACAGSGVDALLALVSGNGPVPAAPGVSVRAQTRCQRAVIGAASRYGGKRIAELTRGARPARRASVFATVQKACDGVAPAIEQGVAVPSLGAPCAASAPVGGPLDGKQMARCARAGVERLLGAMTRPVRPNVIVVMTDDQNLASIAWMNRVQSWRRRSTDFSKAYVSTPVCGPSRSTFLTGDYAQHHGVISNYLAAPALDPSSTIATWLHDGGYVTGLVGKYMNYEHLLPGVPEGWDEWQALDLDQGGEGFTDYGIDENGTHVRYGGTPREYSTDLLAGRALDFVRTNRGAPFFLLFTPYAPHLPAIPAPRHAGTLQLEPPWRPANWHEPDVSTKPGWVAFVKFYATPEATALDDADRIRQLESLQSVDEAFGRLEDLLEKMGLLDNTVVVFTSDHGYHWGEHWWNSKFTEYEESLRVPLVVSYPARAPEPATRDQIVVNVDLAPTIAALAGVPVPSGRDGIDVSALLDGPGVTRDDFLIRNWGAIIVPSWSGVHEGRLKYVSLEGTGGVLEELYDVEADPMELVNLALLPAWASDRDRLRQRLAELRGP